MPARKDAKGKATTDLMTTAEVAKVLGVTPDAVRKMTSTERKGGPAIVPLTTSSGLRLFKRADVDALAKKRAAAEAAKGARK